MQPQRQTIFTRQKDPEVLPYRLYRWLQSFLLLTSLEEAIYMQVTYYRAMHILWLG